MDKTTELKDIYTVPFEQVVVEFNVPGKTQGGIILNDAAMAELRKKQSPCMKVIVVGEKVTIVKVGDYILPSNDARYQQVPLLYRNPKEGIQHAQLHVSDILGIVDTDFAKLQQLESTPKEKIIN